MKQYHILNGDALKGQFPADIEGELIVARECLVDGDVSGEDLETFFKTRARFISQYDGFQEADYYQKTVPEFEKMLAIPEGSEINLWFEDDLFCQVNLWFVLHLLSEKNNPFFLVRPKEHSPCGFGGLDPKALIDCLENRTKLTNVNELTTLWKCYQSDDYEALKHAGNALSNAYSFLLPAIEAHIARIPTATNPGRPKEVLRAIMQRLHTSEFGLVFKEFCREQSIYGFGDLQVKRMFEELLEEEGKL